MVLSNLERSFYRSVSHDDLGAALEILDQSKVGLTKWGKRLITRGEEKAKLKKITGMFHCYLASTKLDAEKHSSCVAIVNKLQALYEETDVMIQSRGCSSFMLCRKENRNLIDNIARTLIAFSNEEYDATFNPEL